MKSLWSGNISFGLINIPIHLYSATKDQGFNFNMLNKDDLSPIRFARIDKKTGEEVPFKNIVKGYEYKDGSYIVLDKEDFKKASPKKTQTINIQQVSYENEIDTKYFEKPYYLAPAKGAEKAYVLLREALHQTNKVAVVKYVFHDREDLGVLKPMDDVLILNQIRFVYEIRPTKDLDIPRSAEVSRDEISLAVKLIDALTKPFNPASFRDTFTDELEEIIQEKAKGKEIVPHKVDITPTKPSDLMAQLRASLEQRTP